MARTPPTTHRYRCIANSIIALHHQRASQLWSKAVETRAKVFFAWRPHNGSHNFHSLQLVGEKSSVVGFGGQVPCARGTHFIFCSRIFSLILRVCNGKSFDLSTAIEHSHTHSGKAIYINRGKHIRKHSPSGHRAMQRWCENIFNGVIIAAFGMRLAFENSFTSSGNQKKKNYMEQVKLSGIGPC